jgi:hypothetical protein
MFVMGWGKLLILDLYVIVEVERGVIFTTKLPERYGETNVRNVEEQEKYMGYHKTEIPKGVLGEASKINEEFFEFKDAHIQNNTIMELLELSDLIGAIESYTKLKYNVNLDDLILMTRATQSAFRDGERK